MIYEYKVARVDNRADAIVEAALNKWALEGWELVTCLDSSGGWSTTYALVLRRERKVRA